MNIAFRNIKDMHIRYISIIKQPVKTLNHQIRLSHVHTKTDFSKLTEQAKVTEQIKVTEQAKVTEQTKLPDDVFKQKLLDRLDQQTHELREIDRTLFIIFGCALVSTIQLVLRH